MKKIVSVVLILIMVLALTACGCKHVWSEATCEAPKTCAECGETEGEALGHTWLDATCSAPKTCSVCAATEGETLAHTWEDATCQTAKTCSVCAQTEGEPLAHVLVMKELTGTTRTDCCTVCNETVTSDVTDLNAAAMELLSGTWNAANVYNGLEVSPEENVFTFEFLADGTVISELPTNPGQGICRFVEYNDFLGQFRYEAEVNGSIYDIALYANSKGTELQWWYRDRYIAYLCARQ